MSNIERAARELLRVGFSGDDFLTQNSVPMATTPGVRRALRALRDALDGAGCVRTENAWCSAHGRTYLDNAERCRAFGRESQP